MLFSVSSVNVFSNERRFVFCVWRASFPFVSSTYASQLTRFLVPCRACGRTPLRYYFILSLLLLLTTGLGNASLGYLNYPTKVSAHHAPRVLDLRGGRLSLTAASYRYARSCRAQVILRSAKVIPAMLCGLLVIQKRSVLQKFISASAQAHQRSEQLHTCRVLWGCACECGSRPVHPRGQSAEPQFQRYWYAHPFPPIWPFFSLTMAFTAGLAMVMTSVLSEALLSNFQEKILKNFGSPQSEMVHQSQPIPTKLFVL